MPLLRKKNINSATIGQTDYCIVTCFDNSMQPMFNTGDPLLIDTRVNRIQLDATYLFQLGKTMFIKHIQRIPSIGFVVISENPAFKEWVLTEEMNYTVLGRVIEVWRGADL